MSKFRFSRGKLLGWNVVEALDSDQTLIGKRGKRGGKFEVPLHVSGTGLDAVRSIYQQMAEAEFRFLLRECGLAIREVMNG